MKDLKEKTIRGGWRESAPPLPRVIIAGVVLLVVYGAMLFYVVGQRELYMNVLQGLRKRPLVDEKALVSA